MNRAFTTGTSGGATVKVSGRGAVQIALEGYGLHKKEREALASDVGKATEAAVRKQRARVAKEAAALIAD